jgi:hypothetical protein
LQGGIVSLKIQDTLLLNAITVAENFVFPRELPMDEEVIDLKSDHRFEGFSGFLVEVQPALNHPKL